jgi:hypothetical protein
VAIDFDTGDETRTIYFSAKPLGFAFKDLEVTQIQPGGFAADLGVQVGWRLKAVDGIALGPEVGPVKLIAKVTEKLPTPGAAIAANEAPGAASAPNEATSVVEPAPELRVDFSGEWLLTASDDMEPLLKESGVGWALRKAAKSAGYGVGKMQQIIKQNGDEITLEIRARNTITQKFTTDGKEAETKSMENEDILMSASWEEDNTVLVIDAKKKKDGSALPRQTRHMEGDKQIITMVTLKGDKLKRTLSRK